MQDESGRPRVLVAVAADSTSLTKGVLGDGYELAWAKSVSHAQTLLREGRFDLIVCGVRFDDSRMLDLLQYCKASDELSRIPFLSMRLKRGKLPLETLRDLVLASSTLGASGFVDFEQWQKNMGHEAAVLEFRTLLGQLSAPAA